ncbi:glycoside hydrolase family 16 protein [Nocardioides marmoriginsengisoli]|uniref:glycoside hydrolase family 16 protein n=1 Tax=Nocardioides marmoriginsengisoli TaxID=661483 RepID=UPI00161891EE|nr:glycoside hydrolase family 16 protein [Nocardioides marmoriginsengisoli]
MRGKVPGHVSKVRLERRISGRWVLVKRVAARNGRYLTWVRPVSTTRYRAALPRRSATSRAQVVRVVRPATDTCGVRPTKPDGSLWSCTLHDEFTGTSLDRTTWVPQTNFASGVRAAHACYRDDPSVVSQSGGSLNLSVRKVSDPVTCSFAGLSGPTHLIAGGVMTYHLFSQQYGRFEARIRTTATTDPGLHEAFWLWPDDRFPSTAVWPYAGEIDISETYSSHPSLSIPFLHYAADARGSVPGTNTAWDCTAARGEWNTYTLEWGPSRIEIKVNGRTCLVNTSGDAAFQKPYLVVLTQLLGVAGNAYDGRAPLPATMNVDYLRVWR